MRHNHTETHHNPLDFSGRVIIPLQRPPPAQHTQDTNIHAPAGYQPATQANERPETHALNRAASEIGFINKYANIIVIHTFLRAVAQSGYFRELEQTFPVPFLPPPTHLPTYLITYLPTQLCNLDFSSLRSWHLYGLGQNFIWC